MGIHAIGLLLGLLNPRFQISKVQSIRMESGTQKERTLRDLDGANEYYMQKFMVEDDVEIKLWLSPPSPSESVEENQIFSQEIEASIETSWSKTYHDIEVLGSLGKISLDVDEMKRYILKIEKIGKSPEIRTIPPQARDSHQLEIIDFINRIVAGKKSIVDEDLAHTIQTIVSAAYLSNLRAFESSQKSKVGIPITPSDLDTFYTKIQQSECPQSILLEEIVYRFMSPFTSTYHTIKK